MPTGISWWTSRLVPTDVRDPDTGEPLYVNAKVRPRWYWWLMKVRLFLALVWREWEPGIRIGWRTAWEVAGIVHDDGLTAQKVMTP